MDELIKVIEDARNIFNNKDEFFTLMLSGEVVNRIKNTGAKYDNTKEYQCELDFVLKTIKVV
tara:strand:+ start:2780 stop:2965 length:186 start_codon:yes stop_codon:yes gene_type:complete